MGPLLLLFKRFEEKLTPKKQTPTEMLRSLANIPEASPGREVYARNEVAQRDPIRERYDLLDPTFLRFMALIGGYGAKKYGDGNWKLSPMTGDKSPINHIHKHIHDYQREIEYDHREVGAEPYIHLVAIAFNAMMEFYHAIRDPRFEHTKSE